MRLDEGCSCGTACMDVLAAAEPQKLQHLSAWQAALKHSIPTGLLPQTQPLG
jgi:hypothetical protein